MDDQTSLDIIWAGEDTFFDILNQFNNFYFPLCFQGLCPHFLDLHQLTTPMIGMSALNLKIWPSWPYKIDWSNGMSSPAQYVPERTFIFDSQLWNE